MNWNKWVRQTHRWLSIVFTVLVIINIVVNIVPLGQEELTLWVGLFTLLPLAFHLGGTELLHLRILIDKSIVEVFANDRQAAVRRIYPSYADSVQVKLFSEGGATRIHSLTGWAMMPANPF